MQPRPPKDLYSRIYLIDWPTVYVLCSIIFSAKKSSIDSSSFWRKGKKNRLSSSFRFSTRASGFLPSFQASFLRPLKNQGSQQTVTFATWSAGWLKPHRRSTWVNQSLLMVANIFEKTPELDLTHLIWWIKWFFSGERSFIGKYLIMGVYHSNYKQAAVLQLSWRSIHRRSQSGANLRSVGSHAGAVV